MSNEQTGLKALVPEFVLTRSAMQGPEAGVYRILSITVPVPEYPHDLLWPRDLEDLKRAGYRVRYVGC
ncbi:hypothetical protein LCGC14_2691110 [marine sediment metagenome]|uniref:Uncharacterized protein n=1 Tax=marine sediment metagenome TaxID=412755 RepID=A0A0F9A5Z6_9ZZZZ